ncbi:putative sodium-coupled neutral amino acid transporter 11 [Limulus polyphemus]|uniref:Putative sodium-coupled neutral amino acid transporter 11 n=1 Tax=Limulus polyphemus TaxID=6850 RepID=A0ABM1BFV5_LIMPO|nr:putative sodium-coupled neutral amino acid transporter 11 [Limulus polyphemus]
MAAPTENTYMLDQKDSGTSIQAGNMEEETASFGSPQDTKMLVLEEQGGKKVDMSNLQQTGFNYINSIIGSGIIGIAYALRQAGFGLGIILLLFIALITDYSLCILVKSGNIVGATTYQDLVHAAFGSPGFYFLTFIQFVYPYIAMVSYNVIIGDTITKVFLRMFNLPRDSILGNRNLVVLVCTLIITLPLSLLRNISRLNKVSLVSLVFAVFIMLFVLVRLGTMTKFVPVTEGAYSFANYGITNAIGVIAFAYMCHHNSFLLYAALENPSQKRWNQVTHISISAACMMILVFGICGYVTFTGFSQGDLLENYCMDDDWANVARLLFTITIMLTYPIECFVTREGVLAAVPLAYVLPAVTYLKLESGSLFSWQKLPAFLMALWGMVVAVCGLVIAIVNMTDQVTCSHGEEMPYCKHSPLNPNTSLPLNITGSFFNHISD